MRDFLVIHINGQRHEIRGELAFRSLSDFLRYDLGLTGTKVVCAEGDCGSCTVLVGRVRYDAIEYRTICSCIQFLYQLDATHVITVEGLSKPNELNVVQESMVKCHGAQCGFCTPGFVVSMCAMFDRKNAEMDGSIVVTACDVRESLVGNLCRCTGYEPIIKAALDVDPLLVPRVDELYPSAPLVTCLQPLATSSLKIQTPEYTFLKPIHVAEATTFKGDHPECTIISGGTDIGVQINKGLRDPKIILSIASLHELEGIKLEHGSLNVGACASLTDLELAMRLHIPEYAKLLYHFGSPPIRNAGTIGGNIANGSPIGDSMPTLFALDAEIELAGPNGTRRININSFYSGYRKTVMTPEELISRVFIPIPPCDVVLKLYKISRRKDLDISAVTAAFLMMIDEEVIRNPRIVFGGVAPMILRLPKTQDFLNGASWSIETLRQAGAIARSEVKPISDVRGTADYRSQLVENLLLKFFHDVDTNAPARQSIHR